MLLKTPGDYAVDVTSAFNIDRRWLPVDYTEYQGLCQRDGRLGNLGDREHCGVHRRQLYNHLFYRCCKTNSLNLI